ncbi:MAG: Y-family DNA polymerase, partial [Casimicrobiaceae bacterium]
MAPRFLCVHLPALPLQAHAHIGPAGPSHAFAETAPLVIIERQAQRSCVVARNRLAARAGIAPGQTLAQAHALAEPLVVLPRDPLREQVLLERLAQALATFTPHVHIRADRSSLIAEVAASLKLFGGIDALCDAVMRAVEPIAARHHLIAAPSATAADWLARTHRRLIAHPPIADWLGALPIHATDWPAELVDELGQLNLTTVGEVDRLPKAELARRFGRALIDSLDRAHARREEVLAWWQAATAFRAQIELLDPAEQVHHWRPGVEALLADLERFLRERALAARAIELRFHTGR